MRTRSERVRDRASMLTPPYEEPAVMIAHAIIELCWTVDDAAERLRAELDQLRLAVDRYANEPASLP